MIGSHLKSVLLLSLTRPVMGWRLRCWLMLPWRPVKLRHRLELIRHNLAAAWDMYKIYMPTLPCSTMDRGHGSVG